MTCIQLTASQVAFNVSNLYNLHRPLPISRITTRLKKTYVRQRAGASTYKQCTPVCLFGGKGKSENDNEASPWKSREKAMGSLKKEQSLEDVLRQQMEKQEYYDDGGSGGNRPM